MWAWGWSGELNVGLRLVVYDPMCLKLGMMTDCIDFYSLIPVSMTLTFIQCHRVKRKPEQSSQSV